MFFFSTVRPPATVFQDDIRTVIAHDKETASNFINNSLNYLNWAFSEFISLFQEVCMIVLMNNNIHILNL